MIDPSLLDLFRAELEIHLPALSEGLLAMEKNPSQTSRHEALMRAAHSIKGAAKIVGIEGAVRLAHAMEDCFVAAQEGRIALTTQAIDVLLRSVDALPRTVPTPDGSYPDGGLANEALGQLFADIIAIRDNTVPTSVRRQSVPATSSAAIRPNGNLNTAEAERLRVQLVELLDQGIPEILVDFAAVQDVDPVGLAVLALGAKAASECQPPVALRLSNVAASVGALLHLTGLDAQLTECRQGR